MNKKSSASKIELKKFDDLFGVNDISADNEALAVRDIPIAELHEFKNHPFKIHEKELEEMVESVRQYGVLVPGICRARTEGGFEIIAGHTRCEACKRAGVTTMPMIIKEVDDDEATIIMVDSNIQREDVLVSEKAKAYKMRYDAMKHQGVKGNSLKAMSEETGENEKKIQRFIWLARLSDTLLDMVDNKKLPMAQAVDLSFLSIKEQVAVVDVMNELHLIPTMAQTSEMKTVSMDKGLDRTHILAIICPGVAKKSPRKVTFKADKLSRYFDDNVTEKEITEIIIRLLDEWKRREGEE